MTYKIEITENSINIKTQQQLYDIDGNPVALGPAHRKAIAVGDFAEDPENPTPAERAQFKIARDALVLEKTGKALKDI